MANTFKFGNGNWAVKKDSVLAYNDENNNFKPLPFDFTRDSTATYVDSDGLIKTAGKGEARIDYLDNADGHLLLEPVRRNIAPYSEDGTQWDTVQTTISLDNSINKPDGVAGAYKVTDDTEVAQHRADVRPTVVSGTQYTFSAFVKQAENSDVDFIYLLFATSFATTRIRFNIANGTAITSDGTIEDYGNGWYRVSGTATANADGQAVFGVNLMNANTGATYAGTGNGAMYVYGIQVEDAGSGVDATYATSYIPTNGSSVTRAADDIALTFPDDASFDSSNGFTIYGQFLTNGGSGTSNNFLQFQGNTGYVGFGSTGVTWRGRVNNGTTNELHNSDASITTTSKLSISFDGDGYSMYANGTSFKTGSTDISTITSIDSVFFRDNTEEFGSMQIRELKLYNTRLTDAELETLTT